LPPPRAVQDLRMSEHTDATEDRDDEPEEPVARDEPDADEPQPWAKALPGDGDENE
jgi:hypothetical protein